MGEVIKADFSTTLGLPPEKVLGAALESTLDSAIIIGMRSGQPYYASTMGDIAQTLLETELFKQFLLERARE